jgi:predicted secreted protein
MITGGYSICLKKIVEINQYRKKGLRSMQRGRKIILVAHCLLNANAKVGSLCTYPAALTELMAGLFERGIGVIQLPCPEMLLYGSRRWGHVKEQFSHPAFRRECRQALQPIVEQLVDYRSNGYLLVGVVGIDGSPSCGVVRTCSSVNWSGDFLDQAETWSKVEDLVHLAAPGVMMEELIALFATRDFIMPFFAVDEQAEAASVDAILAQLDNLANPDKPKLPQ